MVPLKVGLEKTKAWQLHSFDVLTKWNLVVVKDRETKRQRICGVTLLQAWQNTID
jgi:hypothetical protein